MTPQAPDINAHAALEREKFKAASRQIESQTKSHVVLLVKEAIKRHKAIHNDACRSIEEVALNKKSAEDMLVKRKKYLDEALAKAARAAETAARQHLNELQKMEEAVGVALLHSGKQISMARLAVWST